MSLRRLLLALCLCLVASRVSAQTFTDDPLVQGVTPIKAIHISELRQAINQLRATAGLQAASWTDATLTPGVTVVRAVHVLELRARLDEAITALGHSTSPYTDSTLAGTPIKAVHIAELRARVRGQSAPAITSLSPSSGSAGTAVAINGTSFGSSQGSSTVKFNGIAASVTSWSDTHITAIVPTAATTGNVVVTVSSVASNGMNFTVTVSCTYSVSPSSVSLPASGGSGQFTVTTPSGCPISPTTTAGWLSVITNGTTVTVQAAANQGPSRSASISIDVATVSVAQAGNGSTPPEPDAGTVVYYHTDAIGSVRLTTDQNGSVIQHYDFQPFGVEWPSDSTNESRLFAGKERDATTHTGFDYFGARYYSALFGRFTTADSSVKVDAASSNPQLWDRYSYASNNPFRFVDPDGRWSKPIHELLFSEALGFLSPHDVGIVQRASAAVDFDQSAWGAPKHAMRAPWQSVRQASNAYQDFVGQKIAEAQRLQADWEAAGFVGYSPDALWAFGQAAHAVQDSFSPSHQGFQVWSGIKEIFTLGFWRNHKPEDEETPSPEEREQIDEKVRDLFATTFGQDAVPEQREKPE